MTYDPKAAFGDACASLSKNLDDVPMTYRQREDAQHMIDVMEQCHRDLEREVRATLLPDVRAETWRRIIDRSDDMVREIEKRQEAGAYIALDSFIRRCAEEDGVTIPSDA